MAFSDRSVHHPFGSIYGGSETCQLKRQFANYMNIYYTRVLDKNLALTLGISGIRTGNWGVLLLTMDRDSFTQNLESRDPRLPTHSEQKRLY